MDGRLPGVSDAFKAFLHEAPAHAGAWMEAVRRLGAAGTLDPKTETPRRRPSGRRPLASIGELPLS